MVADQLPSDLFGWVTAQWIALSAVVVWAWPYIVDFALEPHAPDGRKRQLTTATGWMTAIVAAGSQLLATDGLDSLSAGELGKAALEALVVAFGFRTAVEGTHRATKGTPLRQAARSFAVAEQPADALDLAPGDTIPDSLPTDPAVLDPEVGRRSLWDDAPQL